VQFDQCFSKMYCSLRFTVTSLKYNSLPILGLLAPSATSRNKRTSSSLYVKVRTMWQRLRHWFKFNLAYLQHPPWDTNVSPPELLAFIQAHPPSRALDLGCGTGTNVITLAKAGWQTTGIDFVPSAIAQARRKAHRAKAACTLRVGDVTRLMPDLYGQDLILDIGCFHGLGAPQRAAYLDGVRGALTPSGHWLVYVHVVAQPEEGRSGITEADIAQLNVQFHLVSREDGRDTARKRASAWLLYAPRAILKI
jgi:SAM-dependent methyltransferase